MFILVFSSRTTLWKSQKYYMVWILFYFWSLGLTTVSLLLSFSTLFFRHNSRHYVIFQLQINYLTGLPFVLSLSDPFNFERLSKIHSCMFFHTITVQIIYMKKILNSDWQRAMQFFSKYNAKKRNTGQKRNTVRIKSFS
jgi:hypothetical protein